MNKLKALVLLGVCGAVLGACGNDSDSATEESKEKVVVSSAVESTEESTAESESNDGVYSFKDNELVTPDLKIKITDTKIIPAGETGNEYGEKSVIAFWYDTTNLTDDETDPSTAWIMVFRAYQDNDENSLNELNVGSLPDEQFLDSQMEIIKKDGTVSNAVSYELDDDVTPVTLRAEDMLSSKTIAEVDYEIK